MIKTLICLVLSAVFAFLSFYSFMTNDYRPLQQWLAYYREYKVVEEALSRGGISPDDLRSHLNTLILLYPGQSDDLEQKLESRYGDMLNQSQETQNFLADTLRDTIKTLTDPPDISTVKEEAVQHLPDEDADDEISVSFSSDDADKDEQPLRKNP